MNVTKKLLLPAVVLAFTLTACGSDDDDYSAADEVLNSVYVDVDSLVAQGEVDTERGRYGTASAYYIVEKDGKYDFYAGYTEDGGDPAISGGKLKEIDDGFCVVNSDETAAKCIADEETFDVYPDGDKLVDADYDAAIEGDTKIQLEVISDKKLTLEEVKIVLKKKNEELVKADPILASFNSVYFDADSLKIKGEAGQEYANATATFILKNNGKYDFYVGYTEDGGDPAISGGALKQLDNAGGICVEDIEDKNFAQCIVKGETFQVIAEGDKLVDTDYEAAIKGDKSKLELLSDKKLTLEEVKTVLKKKNAELLKGKK